MVEPFKNFFGPEPIRDLARHLSRVSPTFPESDFLSHALEGLDELELKQRSTQITDALIRFLPSDYHQATQVLLDSLHPETSFGINEMEETRTELGVAGWMVMPMADLVSRRGMDDIDFSLEALRQMTMRSSSEFAIRAFLDQRPDTTLKTLHRWSQDPNEHVRRLVSEGSRPRLPWGMRLTGFVKDPSPVMELLEKLKDDPSEYVRRSVANNLNDIAKDHPKLVTALAQDWMRNASTDRARLIRHALRSLVKAGDTEALAVLGYGRPIITLTEFSVLTPIVKFGQQLEFTVGLISEASSDQQLMIDYVIHHVKANGKTSPKVFKWKNLTMTPGESMTATRRHSIRAITTRRYYPGVHRVELQINGETVEGENFGLSGVPD